MDFKKLKITKYSVLYLVFAVCLWPNLFRVIDLLRLKPVGGSPTFALSLMLEPKIIVFDRDEYFPEIYFEVYFKDRSQKIINFDSNFFSKIKPYTRSVLFAHALTKVNSRERLSRIEHLLDSFFCKKNLSAGEILGAEEVQEVIYHLNYISNPLEKEITLGHKCLKS